MDKSIGYQKFTISLGILTPPPYLGNIPKKTICGGLGLPLLGRQDRYDNRVDNKVVDFL